MTSPEGDADDHALAHHIADEAARRLVAAQRDALGRGQRGWALEDIGDGLAHDYLVAELGLLRSDDGLLSEEGHDDGRRVGSARAWIVDPLDGSSGYGVGNGEWAVHVALSVDGAPRVGAVAVPALGLTASTHETPAVPERRDGRPVVVTGRTRSFVDGAALAHGLDAELTVCSSAGVKAMLVVTGQADIYVHDAPLYEWDVCAPVAVALAAGLSATDNEGRPLLFNKDRPTVPGLVISRPEFATDVVEVLRASR